MKKHDSEYTFTRIQLKSIEKIRLFAKLLEQMEIEFWIRTTKITLSDCFICPDITDEELDSLNTTMEKLLVRIIKKIR